MRLYLKDYVTLASLVSGMAAIFLVLEGRLPEAAFTIWVAYLFDALDGLVARITKKKNAIGGHLDNTVDYITCAIAPAVLIYGAYAPLFGRLGAAVLASVPALTGTLRHARNYANPPEVTNLWVGLPRSYSGLGIAALIGSHAFLVPWVPYAGIGYIVVASWLNITAIGYQGRHHLGLRTHQRVFFILTILTWVFGVVMLALGYGYRFFSDGQFVWMTAYMILGCWLTIPPDERRTYREQIREWKGRF